jgi:hypothetical protein
MEARRLQKKISKLTFRKLLNNCLAFCATKEARRLQKKISKLTFRKLLNNCLAFCVSLAILVLLLQSCSDKNPKTGPEL